VSDGELDGLSVFRFLQTLDAVAYNTMECISVFIGFLSGDRASSVRINCCGWLDRWLGPPASSLLLGQQLVGHTIDWTAKENLTIRMCIMAAAHFDSSVFGVTLTHTQMYSVSGFSQQFTRPSQIPPLLHDASSLFMPYDRVSIALGSYKIP
jgi:hypothetical protein